MEIITETAIYPFILEATVYKGNPPPKSRQDGTMGPIFTSPFAATYTLFTCDEAEEYIKKLATKNTV